MKFSECNMRQKKAWRNIKYAAIDLIFGLENGCTDNPVDSEAYRDYLKDLRNLEALKATVYHESITSIYDEGFVGFGAGAESYLKDIRFCGKEFLMKLVTKYCTKFQTEALSNLGVSIEDEGYTPSSTAGDYGPGNPWDAPGMSVRDFI